MKSITFRVYGVPKPGGSKRAITLPGKPYSTLIDTCKGVKTWRSQVAKAARAERIRTGFVPFDGPILLNMSFTMPRPKSHFGSGKNAKLLKPSAPHFHVIKPDVTKLIRSTEDSLKGIVWGDDSQVVVQSCSKAYECPTDSVGALITIQECAR